MPDIGNNTVSGYFSYLDNELVIHYTKGWEEVLAHEFNHYLQYIENSKEWSMLSFKNSDCLTLMWNWMDGEIELTDKELDIVFSRVRNLEHDCEKRTVKMLRLYHLSDNLEKYIKEANLYIMFYNVAKIYRKWIPDRFNDSKYLYSILPSTLSGSRTYKSMSKNIIEFFGKNIKMT